MDYTTLYSEIDHIHLSSEAQCVSHLYPQVDCHKANFRELVPWANSEDWGLSLEVQWGEIVMSMIS